MSDALDLAETQLLFAPIEAILMVVDQPVTAQQLAGVLNVSAEDIEHVLEALSRNTLDALAAVNTDLNFGV